ncbi:MAG: D-tyrosyl-tRNA(Tyr) deacylase [Deltaproteobacteria bacterium]|nr:MAG: D-tyrosyl-tRNA(Tyr) deacylase [Deltaproteobacteria bacterium]
MRAVVQRVSEARVTVDGELVGALPEGTPGLLVLLGAGDGDGDAEAESLADKICGLRVFEDAEGKMNLGLTDVGGALLVVSQFTLYGDCRKGRRPSFVRALEPVEAARLVEVFVARARQHVAHVATGRFQAHMAVSLVNDGPVTLLLDTERSF